MALVTVTVPRFRLHAHFSRCLRILSHIPGMCGSVTNKSTWIRIGYRIYSHTDYNYYLLPQQFTTKYGLSDLTPLITANLLNTGSRLL
jgi:hypothetical protein